MYDDEEHKIFFFTVLYYIYLHITAHMHWKYDQTNKK